MRTSDHIRLSSVKVPYTFYGYDGIIRPGFKAIQKFNYFQSTMYHLYSPYCTLIKM